MRGGTDTGFTQLKQRGNLYPRNYQKEISEKQKLSRVFVNKTGKI